MISGRQRAPRVEANARLTAVAGLVLLVLLAAEGVTIVSIRRLLPLHYFIGLLLIPPLLLKLATTGTRFVRYYRHDREYRAAGPPEPILRATAPLLVISTVLVLGTVSSYGSPASDSAPSGSRHTRQASSSGSA